MALVCFHLQVCTSYTAVVLGYMLFYLAQTHANKDSPILVLYPTQPEADLCVHAEYCGIVIVVVVVGVVDLVVLSRYAHSTGSLCAIQAATGLWVYPIIDDITQQYGHRGRCAFFALPLTVRDRL